MPELPRITGREAIAAFERLGFKLVRTKGSANIMKKEGHPYLVSVHAHRGRTLRLGTLSKMIKDAGVTLEEFTGALR